MLNRLALSILSLILITSMVGCGDDASPVAPTAVAVEPVGAQAETPPAAVTVDDLTSRAAAMRVYSISLSAASGSSVRVTHVNPSAWAAISATGERLVRLNHNRRSACGAPTPGKWRRFTGRACSDVEWGHGWPNNHDGSARTSRGS